jgi:hypothetical protein
VDELNRLSSASITKDLSVSTVRSGPDLAAIGLKATVRQSICCSTPTGFGVSKVDGFYFNTHSVSRARNRRGRHDAGLNGRIGLLKVASGQ